MTTILNGSMIIYNHDGRTIDNYVGNGTNISGSSTSIIYYGAGKTIAILQPASSSNYACNIPSGVSIGDEVTINIDPTHSSGGWFYLPSGETLIDGVSDRGGIDQSLTLMKISSVLWIKL